MAAGRTLVVDTDVLRSSGDVGDPTSRPVLCARFLQAVVEANHKVAVTSAVFEEWNRHRSRFALRWLRVMFGKKRIKFVSAVPIDLEAHLLKVLRTDKKRDAVLKDRHLVETALAADRRIASLDESVRGLLRECAAAPEFRVLASLVWTNPAIVAESAVEWLRRGAPDEAFRHLPTVPASA